MLHRGGGSIDSPRAVGVQDVIEMRSIRQHIDQRQYDHSRRKLAEKDRSSASRRGVQKHVCACGGEFLVDRSVAEPHESSECDQDIKHLPSDEDLVA